MNCITAEYRMTRKMEPRPGVKYSTTYVIMHPEQRAELQKTITNVLEQIMVIIENDPDLSSWFESQPLKKFPTKTGKYRTALEVVTELLAEFIKRKPDGTAKDIALAPIDRWNRLFESTPWEIALVKV